MSNQPTIETSAKSTNPEAIANAAAKTAETAASKGKREAQAYVAKLQQILVEGAELGNLALDEIAALLGASGNKLGRPSESAFLAFACAVAHRGAMSYERRADLAKKCNAKCNPMFKPVAVLKAKAASTQGTASYRFNAPASVEIALS